MEAILTLSQLLVGIGIMNVWILRAAKPTAWRGGSARTLQEEFATYGLSASQMWVIGTIKVLLAALLIAGLWFPELTPPTAIAIALLMLGAVAMHVKIGDPLRKSVPALSMLALAVTAALLSASA